MRVLITGANGMVARACAAHCGAIGDDVTALTRAELDISDQSAVSETFERLRPDAVINCAAYTDVDDAETNKNECYAANSQGVEYLATDCGSNETVFVTISTDYVFDGEKDGFYAETDTPNPQGVYAASKLDGEQLAANANSSSIIVRSGWIYGHGGTNFLSVMHRLLADGKRITAIRDSYGTPTFADDLAVRLRELAVTRVPGIFHAANSGTGTSYLEFAEMVCEIGGFDKSLIESVTKDDLRRLAPRPVNSRLACLSAERCGLAPLRDWRSALDSFVG